MVTMSNIARDFELHAQWIAWLSDECQDCVGLFVFVLMFNKVDVCIIVGGETENV